MEISIDLKLMKEIVFRDHSLLREMLEEWISDSILKIQEIEERFNKQILSSLFNKVHELKTNFSMIHCYAGIQYCEHLIKKIELQQPVLHEEIEALKRIVQDVQVQINKVLEGLR
jgi:HPt (histidine-containing phosphotransfer) domain-containing protein